MKDKNCLILITIIVIVGLLSGCGKEKYNERVKEEKIKATRDIFAMDTYMTLVAYGEKANEGLDEAVSEIQRLDEMFSVGKEESEVSILNQNGSEIVSDETKYLLEKALTIYRKTEGNFDISVYPLMVEWGFTNQKYKLPTKDKIKELLKGVDASKIEHTKGKNFVSLPEQMKIDFGGIAKGYTSQRIMEIFKKNKLTGGVVSLGGNVQTYGKKPDGTNYKIGIENPFGDEGYIGVLTVSERAVITSGGYERFFEKNGVKYHHILDPKTGYPAESGLTSVTIVNSDGTEADGLSTALFVMGKEKAVNYWKKNGEKDGFDLILVEKKGEITITSGLEKSFISDYPVKVIR